MTWLVRGAFIAALALAVSWGFMERKSADNWQRKWAEANQVAKHNSSQVEVVKSHLRSEQLAHKATVLRHNESVSRLSAISEANRREAERESAQLLDRAAVWRDRNASRKAMDRASQCEARLGNIDSFLSDYIQEVRDVSGR